MKSTGIVRRIDDLGRVVIPKETRRMLNINEGDALEIFIDGDTIILSKYKQGCVICGEADTRDLVAIKDKLICRDCLGSANCNSF